MSHGYDRVMAALARERVDVSPISLWSHTGALPFLGFDYEETCRNGQKMADVHLAFLKKFGIDLLKVTPYVRSICTSWGCRYEWKKGSEWITTLESAVKTEEDWKALKVMNPRNKVMVEELEAANILRREIGGRTPFLWTMMGPLFLAGALAGDDLLLSGIKSRSSALKGALDVVSETLIRFGQECLAAGATGIFYSIRPGAQRHLWNQLTRTELEEFSFRYDLKILEALRDSDIRVLHICSGHKREDRPGLLVELLKEGYFKRFPVDAMNWWDRNYFDLANAKAVYGNTFCLMGGLDQEGTLPHGTPADVEAEARNAITLAGIDGGLVLAPGCTIRVNTPEENYTAAVNAAHSMVR
jgi:uroporphyrinogen decarboxylase